MNLEPIKARLAAVDRLEYGSYKKLLQNAAVGIEALVAEVERLRAAIREHRDETHRKWNIDYGGGKKVSRLYRIASLDEELWGALEEGQQ